jgi:Domain of unknown function (DUF4917)
VPPDGSLSQWQDIADAEEWAVLLLGNGLSINVWSAFQYRSLFDHAQGGGLTPEDLALFAETPNFERVLGDLNTTIRVMEAVGENAQPYYERYRRIKLALGGAVRQVHLTRSQVPNAALSTIRAELLKYAWIFTTSYDLIVYWAMGYGDVWDPFMDHFRYAGRCQFDPARADPPAGKIPVYYLHGALHLVVSGTGDTWKLRRNEIRTILEQFGEQIPGDPQARPLLVTEGSTRDKLRAIEGNDYLAHALARLRGVELPVVVFGSALSTEDGHLVDALNEHRRPVAVSMRPTASRKDRRELQSQIYGRLYNADPLLFFDSTTHPMGSPNLRAV